VADPPGVSVAFDDPPMEPDPTWTRIDTLAGCRVRDWSLDRGRPDEFSKTGTGTAVVHIADRQGLFDPTNASSPYNASVVPGKQAAIALHNPVSDVWTSVFRGFVESWHYRLAPTRNYMDLELQLVDGFAVLERAELIVGEDGALPLPAEIAKGNVAYGFTEGTGADRINAILGDSDYHNDVRVRWPDEWRDVFSLNTRFGPKAYGPGTSCLDAIWDAVDGEFPGVGNAWCSKTGVLTVHGRQARFRPEVAEYGIAKYTVGDPSAWSPPADPSHSVVPVAELEWVLGEDNLYNACSATPQGIMSEDGTTWRMLDPAKDDVAGQYVTDDVSVASYGLRSITFDQLQTVEGIIPTGGTRNALEETKLFASYYVSNYAAATPRLSRLVFKSRRPTDPHGPALWNFLCSVEISDLLTLKTQHPGGGGFNTDFYVEGLHYTCHPGSPSVPIVELALDVSPRANYTDNVFTTDPATPDT
jgi:hypothetical protein